MVVDYGWDGCEHTTVVILDRGIPILLQLKISKQKVWKIKNKWIKRSYSKVFKKLCHLKNAVFSTQASNIFYTIM